MKRLLAYLSILVPTGGLLFWRIFPQFDPVFAAPLLHFYVVTFFTFAAVVVTVFTGRSLDNSHPPRHRLLATAFAVMGTIFFVHGVTTPGAVINTFNPGISWAAWLTFFMGGLVFVLASFDRPGRPFLQNRLGILHAMLFAVCLLFILVVALAPQLLATIDQLAAPWHEQFAFYLTGAMWLWALIILFDTWRQTRTLLDGVMTLIAGWMFIGVFSQFQFSVWNFSWWIYHLHLLLGATVAVFALVVEYERLKRFRLLDYFGALSLLATALLALGASYLIGQTFQRNLEGEITIQAEALSRNLVVTLTNDLPAMATTMDLELLADESPLFEAAAWGTRLAELEIGLLVLYNEAVEPVYVFPEIEHTVRSIGVPESGLSSRMITPETQPYENAPSGDYLQTFVPIIQEGEILGYLSLLQPLPGLADAVIGARLNGLLIAGLAMGLLFLILLIIVHRADRLITTRTNELEQAYIDLRAAESMRDDLTDMVVHDLRTPLTSISLSLDLLEKSVDKPERREMVGRFFKDGHASVQRMLGMISQILDINRFESGQLNIKPTTLQIDELLTLKAVQFKPNALAEKKTLVVKLPASLPSVRADEELISRVLDNLITNSLKYTNSNGQVGLQALQQKNEIIIQVRDDGEGMASDDQARIFDKHFQALDSAGNPLRRGKGLGLTFCKLAVEAHGGRIWVTSTPGQGSTFSFSLPTIDLNGVTPIQ